MSERRYVLLGALAEARDKKRDLALKAQRLLSRLDTATAYAATTRLEEIDTAGMRADASDLYETVEAYKAAGARVRSLEDELGVK
jgi:hypothetical protein